MTETTAEIDNLLHVHTNSVSLFYGSLPAEPETDKPLQLSIPMDTNADGTGSGVNTGSPRTHTKDQGPGQNGASQKSLLERLQQLEDVFLYGKEGTKYQHVLALTLNNFSRHRRRRRPKVPCIENPSPNKTLSNRPNLSLLFPDGK